MARPCLSATAVRLTASLLLACVTSAGRGPASADESSVEVTLVPRSAEARAVAVPKSFLGLSQEWPWVSSMTQGPHALAIIKRLQNDNGPLVLRVGGTSYDAGFDRVERGTGPGDRMQREGVAKSLTALEHLRDVLGMRFILTLSLACRDPEIVQRQADAWQARLRDAVLAYEIGNEPNYYKDLLPDRWPDDRSGQFYRDIVTDFALCCRELDGLPLAGPAWGWIGLRPPLMEQYLDAAPRPLAAVTVHYYHSAYRKAPPPDQPNDTPESLLDDTHTREIMSRWVGPQLAVARRHGVPLRITECNSISGGGNSGVSDVHAAALWTLDTALEMAAAGVAGIDFHQASWKYAIYERVTKGQGEQPTRDPPPLHHNYRVQPPFYGLLFFQQVVTAGSRIAKLEHAGPTAIKAYGITAGDESRIVIVNKSPHEPCRIVVHLADLPAGTPTLVRLVAPDNAITARRGLRIAGVCYDGWGGEPDGETEVETVFGRPVAPSGHAYRFDLEPASAAVLRAPLERKGL